MLFVTVLTRGQIGDSINDQLAFSTAQFSFGIPSHAPRAQEIHTDALMLPDLSGETKLGPIVHVLKLASITSGRVKTVLGWAMVYNALALTLSGGLLQNFGVTITP